MCNIALMQMIPKKIQSVETHWQKELANCFTSLESLLEYLSINPQTLAISVNDHSRARKLFPMRVPRPFADLMQAGNWHDPLLQQVIPQHAEYNNKPGFVEDPLEEQNNPNKGIIHKYKSRILLVVRGGCAVNCRYCFRRHFPYQDNHIKHANYDSVITYVRQHTEINEVIFSGGDPLMANDAHLEALALNISAIANVKRLRIHTRLPVVIPSRINDEFLAWVRQLEVKLVMVMHINHANEVSPALKQKCQQLQQAGVTLLNQSVLLAGINNNADALEALSESLFDAGILPYYLHMFDPVKGASHFDVPRAEGQHIMAELIKRLPGFLVPKLVKELAGQPGKTPIDLKLEP